MNPEEAFEVCEALLSEPLPDYGEESEDDEDEENRLKQVQLLQKTGTR